jgi:hypothetical protein
VDYDADGLCDFGDLDDDADGVPDMDEIRTFGSNPFDPYSCGDRDGDGCDDCIVTGGPPATTNDGADFDADGLCDSGDPDDDNDGLADDITGSTDDEAGFGTDPFDPDTDDDGLMDGTERDMAYLGGGGCPSPTDADSDDDTLSDSVEVTAGTSPCLADTDADGLPDNIDPLPLVPGATQEFLEEMARDQADSISSLDLSFFTGPNANANRGRRNALANRATAAANAIAAGDYQTAINELTSLLDKIDGITPPPDWLAPSPETTALADQVRLLISLLD